MEEKNKVELSIVIPCLNEEKTLPIVIRKAKIGLERSMIKGEVLISDNGSTDNSIRIAEEEGVRVVHCSKRGYGSALIAGFKNAKGKYLLMGDADDSYNFEEIGDFLKYLMVGYEFVIV